METEDEQWERIKKEAAEEDAKDEANRAKMLEWHNTPEAKRIWKDAKESYAKQNKDG